MSSACSIFQLNPVFPTPLKEYFSFIVILSRIKIVSVGHLDCLMPVYSSTLFSFFNLVFSGDIRAPQYSACISADQCSIQSSFN